MGSKHFGSAVEAYFRERPGMDIAREVAAGALQLTPEQITRTMRTIVDANSGEFLVIRRGHIWRFIGSPPPRRARNTASTKNGSPLLDRSGVISPEKLTSTSGAFTRAFLGSNPTFTYVGQAKNGPMVRDQNNKLWILQEV